MLDNQLGSKRWLASEEKAARSPQQGGLRTVQGRSLGSEIESERAGVNPRASAPRGTAVTWAGPGGPRALVLGHLVCDLKQDELLENTPNLKKYVCVIRLNQRKKRTDHSLEGSGAVSSELQGTSARCAQTSL